jgi:hypothetical protein
MNLVIKVELASQYVLIYKSAAPSLARVWVAEEEKLLQDRQENLAEWTEDVQNAPLLSSSMCPVPLAMKYTSAPAACPSST